jgi:putative DNA primase/helicase
MHALLTDHVNDDETLSESAVTPGLDLRVQHPVLPANVVLSCFDQNQWGDALLFKALFSDRVVYDGGEKQWYFWDGHRWSRAMPQIVSVLCAMHLSPQYEALAKRVRSQGGGSKEDVEDGEKLAARLKERAQHLRSTRYIKSMLHFVEGELALQEEWDSNPLLLGVLNGVVELRTGTFRPGRPEDYMRVYAPTEWLGLDAPAPRWRRFLDEVFADPEIVAYLQRLFGYGISGLTIAHLLIVFYGREGRNGKDTLLSVIRHVLGQFLADAVSNDVLLVDRRASSGAAQPHIMALRGKRLAWCSESEAQDRLSVAQVKQLTGGGTITGRSLYQNMITFIPTHKLVLMTNCLPQIQAAHDDPIWDRLKLVEFKNRFVSNPRAANERLADTQLGEILRADASGILAWLVQGFLIWQEQGLAQEPASVRAAVQTYRKDEDVLGLFLEECCLMTPEAQVKAGALYAAYQAWCERTGMKPWSGKVFGETASNRFSRGHTRAGKVYRGLGLLVDSAYEA